jgi:hypothetical protein
MAKTLKARFQILESRDNPAARRRPAAPLNRFGPRRCTPTRSAAATPEPAARMLLYGPLTDGKVDCHEFS